MSLKQKLASIRSPKQPAPPNQYAHHPDLALPEHDEDDELRLGRKDGFDATSPPDGVIFSETDFSQRHVNYSLLGRSATGSVVNPPDWYTLSKYTEYSPVAPGQVEAARVGERPPEHGTVYRSDYAHSTRQL